MYNAANLPIRLYNSNGNTIYDDFTYDYRLDGNLSAKTELTNGYNNTVNYNYDTTGRLVKEEANGINNDTDYILSYVYDNAGNRSSMTLSGNAGNYTENYAYDKNNRLIASSINYGAETDFTDYSYDKNGNQIKVEKHTENNDGKFKLGIISASYKNNTGIEKFTYNGLNQLTNYESTNGQYNGKVGLTAEYKYMANGYRLSKSVNGLETRYLWDKDNIVSELNDLNVISQKYYRGHNLICDDSNNLIFLF